MSVGMPYRLGGAVSGRQPMLSVRIPCDGIYTPYSQPAEYVKDFRQIIGGGGQAPPIRTLAPLPPSLYSHVCTHGSRKVYNVPEPSQGFMQNLELGGELQSLALTRTPV